MKHWEKDKFTSAFVLHRQKRMIGMIIDEDGVYISENCDNYYSVQYTKQQAIELLEEAINLIKVGE